MTGGQRVDQLLQFPWLDPVVAAAKSSDVQHQHGHDGRGVIPVVLHVVTVGEPPKASFRRRHGDNRRDEAPGFARQGGPHLFLLAAAGSKKAWVWRDRHEFAGFKCKAASSRPSSSPGGGDDKICTGHKDEKVRVWRTSDDDPAMQKRVGSLPRLGEFLRSSVRHSGHRSRAYKASCGCGSSMLLHASPSMSASGYSTPGPGTEGVPRQKTIFFPNNENHKAKIYPMQMYGKGGKRCSYL